MAVTEFKFLTKKEDLDYVSSLVEKTEHLVADRDALLPINLQAVNYSLAAIPGPDQDSMWKYYAENRI